jgi:NAD(P)-dependent dehydrogenase (short-subunit alcohol dehydrogenase family)
VADPPSSELAGAVATVTGAAGGVGKATVELLTARGARVVAEDLNPAVGELEGDQRREQRRALPPQADRRHHRR